MKIKVIDYAPGSGKTSYITKYMTQNPQNKYLYITPLLSEAIGRVAADCSSLDMVSPDDSEGLKSEHISKLLKEGKHISSTHSMFKKLKQEHIELIREYGYVIILDEVIDYISPYDKYKYVDICDLFDSGILSSDQENLGRVSFNTDKLVISDGNYYEDIKNLCNMGMLYSTIKPANLLNIQVPLSILEAAKEVVVMTYMFDSSIMYSFFKLRGVDFEYMEIPELRQRETKSLSEIKNRLKIIDIKSADKLLSQYKDSSSLSFSWWETAVKDGSAKQLFKSISNYLINNVEYSKSFYFSAPKFVVDESSKKSILVKYRIQYFRNTSNYTDSSGKVVPTPDDSHDIDCILDTELYPPKWIPLGTKATNIYRKRSLYICLNNIYPNLNIDRYMTNFNCLIDKDKYALSEFIQMMYRGCIRDSDGGSMSVYIGSPRMKSLVLGWLSSIQ